MGKEMNWEVDISYLGAVSGAENMARDKEVFLRGEAQEDPHFFKLMLYHWKRPTLSLGFMQKANELLNFAALERAGVCWVNRCSGGKAVLHHEELTYAVVCGTQHPLFGGNLRESYAKISAVLLHFLNGLLLKNGNLAEDDRQNFYRHSSGSPVNFYATPEKRMVMPNGTLAYDEISPEKITAGQKVVCYAMSGFMEIMMGNRKLIGSAQKRGRTVFLQHGSLPLRRSALQMGDFFNKKLSASEALAAANYAALFDDLPAEAVSALGDTFAARQKMLATRAATAFKTAFETAIETTMK